MVKTGLKLLVVAALAASCAWAWAWAPSALAGEWVQVSCMNPNGSASTNQGWTTSASSSPAAEDGSNADVNCSPGSPMVADLSSDADAPTGAYQMLQWAPPSGSTLIGGTIDASGYGGGTGSATATSVLYSPDFVYNGSNVFYQCVNAFGTCQSGYSYSSAFALPSNQGGGLYLQAACQGDPGTTCSEDASDGEWASVALSSAEFLMSNASVPTGTGFSGTLLQADARGVAQLLLTASDPDGPGVYNVTAKIDGATVYSATPDSNNGDCAAVGTYGSTGALEFDYAQPCPQAESVDIPVNTAALSDGSHELTVTVTDAAGNSATVLDQDISTSNPVTTPLPTAKRSVKVRFHVSWRWTATGARMLWLKSGTLPKGATLRDSCLGSGCPRLRPDHAPARRAKRLLAGLVGRQFKAGDRVQLTVTAPGRKAERIEWTVLAGDEPAVALR